MLLGHFGDGFPRQSTDWWTMPSS